MSVIAVTVIPTENKQMVVTWAGLAAGDTGKPVLVENFKTITVQRTAGAGTCTMEGSNDGVTFGAIGAGVAADGTIKTIPEGMLFIRPNVTVSGGNTVVLVMSNPQA